MSEKTETKPAPAARAKAAGASGGVFSPLGWYMGGQFSWFSAHGMQFIIFPAIVAILLQESPARIGLAQMSLMLPALLFMLAGGVAADRNENRALLMRLQFLAVLPPLALAGLLLQGAPDYTALILYGTVMGTISAFVIPARDSFLMSIVDQGQVQKAVTGALMMQFAGLMIGMSAAGLPWPGGIAAMLVVQSALLLAAMVSTANVSVRSRPIPPELRSHLWRELAEGISEAFGLKMIAPVLIIVVGVGLFYIGAFMVMLPLLIRDYYDGGVGGLSVVNLSFWSGTIFSTMLLMRFGRVERSGRLLFIATGAGLVILFSLSIPMSFWVLCLLMFIWGCGAGLNMSMGRTIVQENSPASHRARIMSIYQLSFMGGGPLGAGAIGLLAQNMDLHRVFYFPAAGMTAILVLLLLFTPIWQIRSNAASE